MNKSYTAVWEKNIAMNNTGNKNLVPACKQIDNYYQLAWYQIFSLDYQGNLNSISSKNLDAGCPDEWIQEDARP